MTDIAFRRGAEKPHARLMRTSTQTDQLARAVERLGWNRATPEQALAAKLHVRDELRRLARQLEPARYGR